MIKDLTEFWETVKSLKKDGYSVRSVPKIEQRGEYIYYSWIEPRKYKDILIFSIFKMTKFKIDQDKLHEHNEWKKINK